MYVLIASLGAGMAAGAVRWAVIDTIHHHTGLCPPKLDFGKLEKRLAAFYAVVDNHYRYYQFYSNTLIALVFVHLAYRFGGHGPHPLVGWKDGVFVLLILVFGAASRDALRRYYARAEEMLGSIERNRTHDKRIRPRRRTLPRGQEVADQSGRVDGPEKEGDIGEEAGGVPEQPSGEE
jgi:hypothetical protein